MNLRARIERLEKRLPPVKPPVGEDGDCTEDELAQWAEEFLHEAKGDLRADPERLGWAEQFVASRALSRHHAAI